MSLGSRATLDSRVILGSRVTLGSHVTLGSRVTFLGLHVLIGNEGHGPPRAVGSTLRAEVKCKAQPCPVHPPPRAQQSRWSPVSVPEGGQGSLAGGPPWWEVHTDCVHLLQRRK